MEGHNDKPLVILYVFFIAILIMTQDEKLKLHVILMAFISCFFEADFTLHCFSKVHIFYSVRCVR